MEKVRFIDLRNRHHFDIIKLAEQAMVHPEVVYKMLLSDPVPHDYAVMVLQTLSKHTGEHYTLDNVEVKRTSF